MENIMTNTLQKDEVTILYKELLKTAKQHDHYDKTWKLYNLTYKETKCHKQALNIAYWDLWLDTDGKE